MRNIITKESLGNKYPYTLDRVKLRVAAEYPYSVFVEDDFGNKFAVNGNAHVYLQQICKDEDYRGYTDKILISGKSDDNILEMGFDLYDSTYKGKIFYTNGGGIFAFCFYVVMLACCFIAMIAAPQYLYYILGFTVYVSIRGYADIKRWERT